MIDAISFFYFSNSQVFLTRQLKTERICIMCAWLLMYTSRNPFTNGSFINFVICFPCPRTHFCKSWSRAPVTLLCLLVAFLCTPSCTFIFSHYTPIHSCYISSTTTLVMTVPLLHYRPFKASRRLQLGPGNATQYALKSITIAVQHLPHWPTHTHTHTHANPVDEQAICLMASVRSRTVQL